MLNFLLIVISILNTTAHPFHVSVCEININSASKSIQVSQRIFIDDLEQVLNKTYGVNITIDGNTESGLLDSLINDYLSEHLRLVVDGKIKKRVYIGSEIEEDGIWCYVEYEGIKKIRSIEVTSTVFLETFKDQANIIHFTQGDYEKSIKLDRNNKSGIFEVKK